MSSLFLPKLPIFAVTGIVGAGTVEAAAADHVEQCHQGRLGVAVLSATLCSAAMADVTLFHNPN